MLVVYMNCEIAVKIQTAFAILRQVIQSAGNKFNENNDDNYANLILIVLTFDEISTCSQVAIIGSSEHSIFCAGIL